MWPVKTANVQYEKGLAIQWCEQMDALLVNAHPVVNQATTK